MTVTLNIIEFFASDQKWRRENKPGRKARSLMVHGGEAEDKEFVELGMEEDIEERKEKESLRPVLFDLAKALCWTL